MKNYIKTSLLIFMPLFITAQGGMVNNGAKIQVVGGTDVKIVSGGVINQANGEISNAGNIYLDEDWTQLGAATTYTGAGWMWFENGSNQNISSVSPLTVPKLRVDNGDLLILGSDVTVSTQVDFTSNGNIQLGTNNLIVSSGATMVNYDANNHVLTNSTGYLQQEVGAGAVFFPVGNSSYNPATVSNSGVLDNFQLRIEDQVWDLGTTGTPRTANIVDRTWHLEEEVAGGSLADITVQWVTGEEIGGFDRSICAVSHWDGAAWDHTMSYTAATNVALNTWTQTRLGQTAFSPFVVEDSDVDLPIELLSFDAKRLDIDNVQLDWATALEINNNGFEVQRMLDNENSFQTIDWVEGAGNTTIQQNYELMDDNSYPNISYYRLKQVDYDGTFSYSPIRAVNGMFSPSDITLLPNPTADVINVRFGDFEATSVLIKIYAADGKVVYNREKPLSSHSVLSLPETRAFAAGTYMLQAILNDGTNKTMKFVKMKL